MLGQAIYTTQICKSTSIRYAPFSSQLGATGVTFVASSGNDGAHGHLDRSCQTFRTSAIWPASSPYVVALGGTQLSQGLALLNATSVDCKTYRVR